MKRRLIALLISIMATVGAVSGCSPHAQRDAALERGLEETALRVDGVISADYTITTQLEGSMCRGRVVVEGNTRDEVKAVMDNVLRSYAGNRELLDDNRVCGDFVSMDGSISLLVSQMVRAAEVSDLREHYDIRP